MIKNLFKLSVFSLFLLILFVSNGFSQLQNNHAALKCVKTANRTQWPKQIADNKFEGVLRQSTDKIWFERNEGQFQPDILYSFRTSFGSMGIYTDKIRLVSKQKVKGEFVGQHLVDLNFTGSNKNWKVIPGNRSTVKGSYNTETGKSSIDPAIYNEITIKNVYEGIDLRLYSGEHGAMEFDWLVKRASDYTRIKMNFNGQDKLILDKEGNLTLGLQYADMKIMIPESYQVINGKKRIVDASMAFAEDNKNTLSYNLSGNINFDLPMVIDPVMLWATYLDNNTTTFDEYAYSIATDNNSNVYVAGSTDDVITQLYMSNVPAGFSSSNAGAEAVIYRLTPFGTSITAWTMTGAGAGNIPSDMEIFPDGRVLVVYFDGRIQIFSSDLGSRLYNGEPTAVNQINTVAVLDNSTFYTGGNVSAALAGALTTGAPDATFAGTTEGFIMRFTVSANTPSAQWATYVGGSGNEGFTAIALSTDKTKLSFSVNTASGGATYPALVNAVDNTIAGSELLVGVLPDQATVPTAFNVFSYLGGASSEGQDETDIGIFAKDFRASVIFADNNYFYVAGNSNSATFPGTAGGFQTANAGGASAGVSYGYDQFVSRIPLNGSAGSGFNSTFIGGTNDDLIGGLVVDSRSSQIMLFGSTFSNNYPVANFAVPSPYYQGTFNGGSLDITYAYFSNDLSTRLFATYLGGTEKDYLGSTTVLKGTGHMFYNNNNNNAYIATTIHSNESTLPSQWMSKLPGFDKIFTGAQSAGRDHHYVFGFNPNTYDFGDAPVSFEAGNAAGSAVSPDIWIGAGGDAENVANNSANADGDDLQNSGFTDDEDGITNLPVINVGSTVYSVTVSVYNNFGSTINLWGWIDANANGIFDASEAATVNVPTSASQQNVTLNFSGLPAVVSSTGYTFLRLRLTDAVLTSANATVKLGYGEVEDYKVTVKVVLSGNVFDDGNGLSNNVIDGTGTNAGGTLYANLVDATADTVIAFVAVAVDGTYSFALADMNTNYNLVLSTTAGTVGAAPPAAGLPAGWANIGEDCCDNIGSDGNINGIVSVSVGVADKTNVNFGIDQLSTADDKTDFSQVNWGGTFKVAVPTLSGNDPEDGNYPGLGLDTIIINTLPSNGILYYNNVAVAAGDTIKNYSPSLLKVDPDDGLITISFTYREVDAAGVGGATGTVNISFSAVLPATLVDFSGKLNGNKVDLNWSSATEINSSYYELERSTDGSSFTAIAKVNARGSASNYQLADVLPARGINYYRLKAVDKNESITYSKIVMVRVSGTGVTITSVKPNPFINNLDLYVDLKKASQISINLYDATGRSVYNNTTEGRAGINWVNIKNLDKLSSGLYLIKVMTDDGMAEQKLFKSK